MDPKRSNGSLPGIVTRTTRRLTPSRGAARRDSTLGASKSSIADLLRVHRRGSLFRFSVIVPANGLPHDDAQDPRAGGSAAASGKLEGHEHADPSHDDRR